jgi:thioredoxin reductase (NADPH)
MGKYMARPVIFAIDDDPAVLQAIEHDLRRHYGSHYRILRAHSGAVALETLKQLKLRNEVVALFVVDQRMPHMSGTDFLSEAMKLFPESARVLLTAYADTEAVIKAINTVKIDYYMVKPWSPPEQNLYPMLDDLLAVWQSSYHPPFEGIRVIGHRWSPLSYQIKDFLARNLIPYQWLDIEVDEEAKRLLEFIPDDQLHLPVVLFEDGSHLCEPTNRELAEKAHLKTHVEGTFYDLIIVGSGPAGLAAAVYGASEGLRTLMIEREAPGGQAGTSSRIENYLGFPSGLSGADLSRRGIVQAQRLGAELLTSQEVVSVRVEGPYRFVKLGDGSEISCHVLLVATGVSYRKLNVPGIEHLTGAGVYYGAAMSEALSCRDEHVYLVGGANSAGQSAMYFSRYAGQVTMLVRGPGLAQSMSQYLIDQISATPNITVCTYSSVVETHGSDHLEALTIENVKTGEREKVDATSLFIFIGAMPYTDWLDGIVERDVQGFIPTGPDLMHEKRRPSNWTLKRDPFLLETNVPGIFVAGDVRFGSVKRVASAVGEGSIAVQFIHRYLSEV